ncbi:hypothetical protein BgAZ_108300 [Babesia gibsoni]|uniref:Uncharacterized protein n=1 Tax=Babesia gibsoni TaxID=33632 RepID=A0AAD8PGH0_BABGI|nr:hypothetical protein BgAZ_108300 [Babesia gibsoni]
MVWVFLTLLVAAALSHDPTSDIHRCSQLSPRSLGIGQYCLSTCEGVCSQRVAIPGTMVMCMDDVGPLPSDCGNGKQRCMCISTPHSPNGYPLCSLLDPECYNDNSVACWTACINHQCPKGMVAKTNNRTNFGCFDSNSRILCVP